jgi:16S rRNA processing protein RimM
MSAGRVGRAHGLDGSFYVTGARPRLLAAGARVTLAGTAREIVRRAGTDQRPIVRLQGVESRDAVTSLRGQELTVERGDTPPLEDGEWWASELEGCLVVDGERSVGTVARLLELPSCEALEVHPHATRSTPSGELLIPMVREAIRSVDMRLRRIDVDMSFLEADA